MTARDLIEALRGASEPQREEIRKLLDIDETVYRAVSSMEREMVPIPDGSNTAFIGHNVPISDGPSTGYIRHIEPPDAPDPKDEAQRQLTDDPAPDDVYEHYKGGFYTVLCQSIKEDTLERLVTYRSNRKRMIWTRTHANFFEAVRLEDGRTVPRFRKVDR